MVITKEQYEKLLQSLRSAREEDRLLVMALYEENLRLKGEKRMLRQLLTEKDQQFKRTAEKLANVEVDVLSLESKLKRERNDLLDAQQEIEALKASNEELKKENKILQHKLEELEKDNEELKKQVNELNAVEQRRRIRVLIGEVAFAVELKAKRRILIDRNPRDLRRFQLFGTQRDRTTQEEEQNREKFEKEMNWNSYLERSINELKNVRVDAHMINERANYTYEELKRAIEDYYKDDNKRGYEKDDALDLLEVLVTLSNGKPLLDY